MGYELDPMEWTNKVDVEGCLALDDWRAAKKMDVTVDGVREKQRRFQASKQPGRKSGAQAGPDADSEF